MLVMGSKGELFETAGSPNELENKLVSSLTACNMVGTWREHGGIEVSI